MYRFSEAEQRKEGIAWRSQMYFSLATLQKSSLRKVYTPEEQPKEGVARRSRMYLYLATLQKSSLRKPGRPQGEGSDRVFGFLAAAI
ncbi:hypothetical protein RRG08_049021 [Elysia crispata]|uniref:Uncharacterized protein n=1 Tax=Elysia crispata TaxID=231223 RepID=A0AAE0ZRS6_9GAST|nr:hypothetical protein RRG08_049021 [Elysia crispata]